MFTFLPYSFHLSYSTLLCKILVVYFCLILEVLFQWNHRWRLVIRFQNLIFVCTRLGVENVTLYKGDAEIRKVKCAHNPPAHYNLALYARSYVRSYKDENRRTTCFVCISMIQYIYYIIISYTTTFVFKFVGWQSWSDNTEG